MDTLFVIFMSIFSLILLGIAGSIYLLYKAGKSLPEYFRARLNRKNQSLDFQHQLILTRVDKSDPKNAQAIQDADDARLLSMTHLGYENLTKYRMAVQQLSRLQKPASISAQTNLDIR